MSVKVKTGAMLELTEGPLVLFMAMASSRKLIHATSVLPASDYRMKLFGINLPCRQSLDSIPSVQIRIDVDEFLENSSCELAKNLLILISV